MQTLVVPIIPQLPHLISASPADASWASTPLSSPPPWSPPSAAGSATCRQEEGPRHQPGPGRRRSVVCAFADSLIPLIVGRSLQGASVGVIPLGISILRDELPPRKVAGAMAIVSATLGVGGAIGPADRGSGRAGGDWHVLFWMSAGLGLVCAALAAAVIPESSVRNPGRFDFVGAIGLSAALSLILSCCPSQGRHVGLERPTHPRPARRIPRVVPGLGIPAAAHGAAARGSASVRPSARALHQPRVDRDRLLDVRHSLTLPSCSWRRNRPGTDSGSRWSRRASRWPGRMVMMALSRRSPPRSRPGGAAFHPHGRLGRLGRRRLGYTFVYFLSSSV